MNFLDPKRMAFALFLLPGVGVFAQTSTGPLAVVAVDPVNGSLASDLVNAATGALSPAQAINGSFGGQFSQPAATDPSGRFVYAVSGPTVYGYTIDARDGALTPVPGSPYSISGSGVNGPAAAVAVEASGRFLYVGATNSTPIFISTDILGYSIDPATGALTAIAGSPFAVSSAANALVSDAAGKFLYSAGNGVSVLAINATTGALMEIAGSPFGSGFNGNGLAMDPQKRFLFVSGSGPGALAGYAINGATGGLTALTGSPFFFGAASNGVGFDGSGRFLFASQNNTNLLWGFVVDATSGNLTPAPGDPFLCGSGGFACMGVAADASGKYVYAGWEFSVEAYQIDGVTGALTWINGAAPGAGGIALAPAAGSPSATLESLQILPPNSKAVAGATQQFTAEGTYSDGTERFQTGSVSWSSSNPGVAIIGNGMGAVQNGLALATGAGSTTITATLGGVTATTSLTVAVPISITVTSPSPTIAVNNTIQMTATGTFSDGSTQNITSQVSWSSSNPAAAPVSATGLVNGLEVALPVTITASSGGVSGATSLTIVTL